MKGIYPCLPRLARMPDNTIVPAGRQLSVTEQFVVPAMIAAAGRKARKRFVEFFTANIENDNTRAAYAAAIDRFLWWSQEHGYTLPTIEPTLIAAYFKQGCPEIRPHKPLSRPKLADSSKKQHLAAIKALFDYLVTGGVVEFNPAASVKGPKVVVEKGKTPVLSPVDARRLLDCIDTTKIAGLRDRALIATMLYAFARVGASLAMNVDDIYENGRSLWLRLHEKGGKYHEMPAHHKLAEYLDAYIEVAGIREERTTPLFRTLDRKRQLTDRRMLRQDAWGMIKRRALQAGVTSAACCHTWRATGITDFVRNDGSIENARKMAAHASSRTTNMYVRVDEEMKQEEVERVRI